MTQLHFDVPDSIAEQIKHKADQAQLSVSKYLAQLIKREVLVDRWPEGYEELFDQWEGEPLKRYSEQLASLGTPIGPNDLMIAATARADDVTLVTNNTREFSRIDGLRVVDWETEG